MPRRFATSTKHLRAVLWAFPIAAASEGRVLVDFTEFLVRDGGDIAGRLRPGSYRFEAGRSTVYVPMTMGFPKNTKWRPS